MLSRVLLNRTKILQLDIKMTEWMKLVKETHAMLKKKNPKATLTDAMKEAKKKYKPKK